MKNKILATLFLIGCLFVSSFAQSSGLPKFKKNESYKSVRAKMLKAGWKPAASADVSINVQKVTGVAKADRKWNRAREREWRIVFSVGSETTRLL